MNSETFGTSLEVLLNEKSPFEISIEKAEQIKNILISLKGVSTEDMEHFIFEDGSTFCVSKKCDEIYTAFDLSCFF